MGESQNASRAASIVEDDADQRSLTAMLLQENGFETIECESAEAALATSVVGKCASYLPTCAFPA
jgi:DNA-binding NtrC family response regulator